MKNKIIILDIIMAALLVITFITDYNSYAPIYTFELVYVLFASYLPARVLYHYNYKESAYLMIIFVLISWHLWFSYNNSFDSIIIFNSIDFISVLCSVGWIYLLLNFFVGNVFVILIPIMWLKGIIKKGRSNKIKNNEEKEIDIKK